MSSSPSPTSLAVNSSARGSSPSSSSGIRFAFWPTFLCEHCERLTQFVGVARVIRLTGVSRSTVYYWMEHGWIHWRVLPNRRRVICLGSLSRFGLDVAQGGGSSLSRRAGVGEPQAHGGENDGKIEPNDA